MPDTALTAEQQELADARFAHQLSTLRLLDAERALKASQEGQ